MIKKFYFFIILNFIFLLIININIENSIYTFSINDFYDLIYKYDSFNIDKLNDYYEMYLTNNNIIYSLNQVNYPSFYSLNKKENAFSFNNSIFVNKTFILNKNYVPKNLVPLTINKINRSKEIMLVDEETLKFAKLMFIDAKKQNLDLIVFSAYRSFERQNYIYNVTPDKEYVALPGESEHQTGLALDISTRNSGLSIHFENTDEFYFLKHNAHKYGFILRYPKDKEHFTGYPYECWHFRFVGVDLAAFIFNNDLSLEEYIYMFIELKLHQN